MRTYAGHSAHFNISLAKTPTEVNNNMYFLQIVRWKLIVYQLTTKLESKIVLQLNLLRMHQVLLVFGWAL